MMGGYRTQKAVHRPHGELMHPQAPEPRNDVTFRGVLVGKRCGGCLALLGYLCEKRSTERSDPSVPGDRFGLANTHPIAQRRGQRTFRGALRPPVPFHRTGDGVVVPEQRSSLPALRRAVRTHPAGGTNREGRPAHPARVTLSRTLAP
jgi:hypothetical protein